jgi:hypothetical protein
VRETQHAEHEGVNKDGQGGQRPPQARPGARESESTGAAPARNHPDGEDHAFDVTV